MNATTELYKSEGRENIGATIQNVAKAANVFDVGTIVIFAASAENVLKLRDLVDDSRDVVAVTFPAGYSALVDDQPQYIGMPSQDDRRRLQEANVSLVQGIMPFHALGIPNSHEVRVALQTLGLFGGGLQLCVQAILMGCDAGVIPIGDRCIAMSADTAIVAHTESAFRFFSDTSRFSIEHIICKPIAYAITRPSVTALSSNAGAIDVSPEEPSALPAPEEPKT